MPSKIQNEGKKGISPLYHAATGQGPIFCVVAANIRKHRDVKIFGKIVIFPRRNFVSKEKS